MHSWPAALAAIRRAGEIGHARNHNRRRLGAISETI
jgi:hypothetical protein